MLFRNSIFNQLLLDLFFPADFLVPLPKVGLEDYLTCLARDTWRVHTLTLYKGRRQNIVKDLQVSAVSNEHLSDDNASTSNL